MNRFTASSLPAGTWNPCCTCPFSSFSDLLLTSVLAYLKPRELLVASAVCTRWNFCAETPQLHAAGAAPASGVGLSRLILSTPRTSPGGLRRVPTAADTTELLHEASGAATRLTVLDLSGAKRADAEAVTELVLRHSRTLRRLVLDGVSCLTDAHVARMLPACTALRHLSLARCAALTDVSLSALPPACFARLTSLDVSSCFGMTGVGLVRALDAAAAAQGPAGRLRVLLARGINPSGVTDALLASLSTHTGLQSLDVSHSDPFGIASASASTAITDDGLAALAARAGGLRSLRLSGWSSLTDAGVSAVVAALPLLTALDLSGCRTVGDEVAAAAAARASITELRLAHTRVTDAGVAALAGGARRAWAVLDVAGCRRLSVPALSSLAAAMHGKGKDRPVLYLGGIPAVREAVGTAHSRSVVPLTAVFGDHVDARLA